MEPIFNSKDALVVGIERAINNVCEEKPYGDVTRADVLNALQEVRDSYLIFFTKQDYGIKDEH